MGGHLQTDRAGDAAHEEGFRLPIWLGTCVFLAILVFFLWEEHRAHILGALPYLVLLACPFLHIFMHRGHGAHGAHEQRGDGRADGGSS